LRLNRETDLRRRQNADAVQNQAHCQPKWPSANPDYPRNTVINKRRLTSGQPKSNPQCVFATSLTNRLDQQFAPTFSLNAKKNRSQLGSTQQNHLAATLKTGPQAMPANH